LGKVWDESARGSWGHFGGRHGNYMNRFPNQFHVHRKQPQVESDAATFRLGGRQNLITQSGIIRLEHKHADIFFTSAPIPLGLRGNPTLKYALSRFHPSNSKNIIQFLSKTNISRRIPFQSPHQSSNSVPISTASPVIPVPSGKFLRETVNIFTFRDFYRLLSREFYPSGKVIFSLREKYLRGNNRHFIDPNYPILK
jgi:hypothetical protein